MRKPIFFTAAALSLVLGSALLVRLHHATSPLSVPMTLVLVLVRVASVLLAPGLLAAAFALAAGHLLRARVQSESTSTGISVGETGGPDAPGAAAGEPKSGMKGARGAK